MPPVLLVLVPVFTAIGASAATAATLSTLLVTSLLTFGANLVIGAVTNLIKGTPSIKTNASTSQLSVREPISYRRVIYGTVRVGGIITDMILTGTNNEHLHMVITLAGHEVNSIGTTIYIDGVAVPLAINGGGATDGMYHPTSGKYLGHLGLEMSLGDPTDSSQPFPVFHTAASAHWTNSHLQQGCAKVHITMLWDQTIYANGMPQAIAFDIQGKKVYDPRDASTAFSNNPALCVRDFLTNSPYGLGVDAATIDDDAVSAAANICDEAVNLKAGGTQTRYTCDGAFDASVARGNVVQSMLTSMAGFIIPPGASWRMFAGAYTDPVMSLTDGDLRGPIKYDTRVSRRDLANGVKGTFIGPDNNWQPSDFTPYQSAAYIAEDGGDSVFQDITLDFTTNPIRAQRLAKIRLEQLRRGNNLVLQCKLDAFAIEPGDTIEFTHDRFGWSSKTFACIHTSLAVSGEADTLLLGVDLTLVPTDANVFAWDETTDEGDFTAPASTTLPDASSVGAPTGLALANVETVRADGLKQLQIKATWTPPTDTHVLLGGKINVYIRQHSNVTISGGKMPWQNTAGINSAYPIASGIHAGTAPYVAAVVAGDAITISYVSGGVDCDGALALPVTTNLKGDPNATSTGAAGGGLAAFPAHFVSGSSLKLGGLIGAFTDVSGVIVSVFDLSAGSGTFTVPAGAVQVQIGINDNKYEDNVGSYVISVAFLTGWRLVGSADGADTQFLIPGVDDGTLYDVKINAVNSHRAESAFDEVDNFAASATSATFAGTVSGTVTGTVSSLDNVADGSSYAKVSGSYVVGGVPYTFKGAWSSVTAYKQGEMVTSSGSTWLCLINNTNSAPTSVNTNWQAIGGGSSSVAKFVRNAQTGTTYPIVDGDLGKIVTLSNASAVAVSIAQAGTAGSFADGWFAWIENNGAGVVTITPTTSTIDGAASMTLAQYQGILLYTDGTNYYTGRMKPQIATGDVPLLFAKDGSVTATGDFNMGSHKLTSVTDPASAQDAATKNYVDLATGGGGGAGRTLKYSQDNTTLTGWTTGGTGTTPTHVNNLLGATDVIKVPNNSYIQRNLGGVITNFNNAVIEFDIAAYNPTVALFDVLFGMDSSGNGGVSLRLDDRGSGAGQQMGLGGTSSAFKSTGTVDSTSVFVTANTEMATRFHHFKIVISSDGSHASWYWNGAAQQMNRAISMAGAYIGVYGEAGSNGCIIMNLTVSQ